MSLSAQTPKDTSEFADIVGKLSSLEQSLFKWHQEQVKENERRENRWKNFFIKMGVIFCGGAGLLWTLSEMGAWYYEKVQIAKMADRYALVAMEMYERENNPEVAMELIQKAIELDDSNFEYRFSSAYINGIKNIRLLLNLDRPFSQSELNSAHAALAEAKFLRELRPERSEAYILESQIYTALKEYDRAEKSIKQAIALDPDSSYGKVRYATLLFNQRKKTEALSVIEDAVSHDPQSKWGQLWYGIILNANNRQQDAIAALRKALELDPKFDVAIYNLGCCYLNSRPRDFAQARALFHEALRINPSNKEAFYQLAMSYGYQDKYDVALTYMDKAIALDEDYLTARKWRAVILFEMKRFQEAADEYSAAIQLDPRNGSLYVRRAEALCECKRYDEAVSGLNFALELNKADVSAVTALAKVYLATNNFDLALKKIDDALAVTTKKTAISELYSLQAKLYASQGDIATAIKSQQCAIEAYKSKFTLLRRAEYLQKNHQTEEALRDLAEINELDPKFAPAWKAAIMILRDERPAQALEKLNSYLSLEPHDQTMVKLKKELEQSLTEKEI